MPFFMGSQYQAQDVAPHAVPLMVLVARFTSGSVVRAGDPASGANSAFAPTTDILYEQIPG